MLTTRALIILAILGLAAVEAQFTCPVGCTTKMCADPANCRKYYDCEPDGVYRITCDQNWLFDEAGKYCDYPDRVDCGDRPLCDINDQNCQEHHVSTQAPCPNGVCEDITCTLDDLNMTFEYEKCSEMYCHCVFTNYKACIEICAEGLVYDPVIGLCDRPRPDMEGCA